MIKGFVPGGVYRHDNSMELDILILGNSYVCDNGTRLKIRFFFVQKRTGRIFQYTSLPKKEKARIKIEDLKYWTRIR